MGVAIAISPNYGDDSTLFIATADGPLRSQDGGESWESSTFGLLDVDALCIRCADDYAESETLWVGTAFGGFFRSRNGGRSWRESGTGLPDAAVQCMDQSADGTLYAGTESDGVFLSSDGGNSWQRAGDELAGHSVNSLAAQAGWLLAGTGLGLFRSTDGGASWQACTGGDFAALALAAETGLLLAGAWQVGLFASTDDGETWQPRNGSAPARLTSHAPPLAVLTPQQELFVVDSDGGAALSTDLGKSWQPLDFLGEEEVCTFVAGAGSGETFTLLAWAEDVIYRRVGQGEWQRLDAPGNGVGRLAISPAYAADGTLLLADFDGYFYLSEDRGESWEELAPPETDGEVLGVALSPSFAEDGRAWLAVGAFDGQHIQVAVLQSDDGGQSWNDVAGLALDTPSLSLLPLADELRRPLLLAAQNRLITLSADPENGELTVDQRFLDPEVQIVSVTDGDGDTLLAATNRGIWQVPADGNEAACIGLADRSVVALFPGEGRLSAVTLGGEVWQVAR